MNYEVRTMEILKDLGIHKRYKGCEYIVECIMYIQRCDSNYIPSTKVMYMDVAKKCQTTSRCIERDMRSVIKNLWQDEKNAEVICKMFGAHNLYRRPSNMEFLTLLHNYIKYERKWKDVIRARIKEHRFICPMTGQVCTFCSEFIENIINELCE